MDKDHKTILVPCMLYPNHVRCIHVILFNPLYTSDTLMHLLWKIEKIQMNLNAA